MFAAPTPGRNNAARLLLDQTSLQLTLRSGDSFVGT